MLRFSYKTARQLNRTGQTEREVDIRERWTSIRQPHGQSRESVFESYYRLRNRRNLVHPTYSLSISREKNTVAWS